MNCTLFQKYVSAYADGELSVEKNLDALEHLNVCPGCARRVADIQQLKTTLKRVISTETAPPELARRIRDNLDQPLTDQPEPQETVTAPAALHPQTSRPGKSAKTGVGRGLLFRFRSVVGAAAVLTMLVLVRNVWFGGSEGAAMAADVVFKEATKQHRACGKGGGLDHGRNLPRDRETAACCLRRQLGLKVVAPDLSNFGYEFIGGDFCGIKSRKGAHILYRNRERPSMLSLFFVEELPVDSGGVEVKIGEQNCRFKGGAAATIFWNEPGRACVACACGGIEKEVLTAIADVVRNADIAVMDLDENGCRCNP
ncbi:MAG: anti-sigma factor family protein [Planctomycetota bacterium]|jgi:anti-sigma factor RsiW